jgi:hypothetical protein
VTSGLLVLQYFNGKRNVPVLIKTVVLLKLDWYMAIPALIYLQYEIQANTIWKNV